MENETDIEKLKRLGASVSLAQKEFNEFANQLVAKINVSKGKQEDSQGLSSLASAQGESCI
jgi:hypothetical protein